MKRNTIIIGGAALALLGLGCSQAASEKTADPDDVKLVQPSHVATSAASAKPKGPQPVTISNEGTLLVGPEVKPGTYRSTVPKDSIGCYWARLQDLTGDDIIENGIGNTGDKMTVRIVKTDKAFETKGCGVWVKIG